MLKLRISTLMAKDLKIRSKEGDLGYSQICKTN